MKKFVSILSLVGFSVALMGCNTINGMGKDVERGGEKVQETAKETQHNMKKN